MDDSGGEELQPKPRPIEEVLPSAELLAHYKGRIDQFEQERDELLAAVDRCAVHRDDVHRLEWENRKRADEIKELQKALSDAQQFLFEERQRLLLLQAENDELKLQEIQDRQRIQQLLAMTQPLEQSVTYKQGGPPNTVTSYPRQQPAAAGAGAGSSSTRAAGGLQQQQHGGHGHTGAAGGGGGVERVLRTVFLPTVDADFLLLKVESLQAQLNEQKQLHEERVAALLTDRQLRAQEEERQRSNLIVQVEALGRQVKQLEEALQTTTRDYITARRERQEAQDAAAAAQAQMVQEVSAARSRLAAVRRQARVDTERAAAAAEGRTREYVDKFREQVRAREEELLNLTALHTATKSAGDKRIAALEGRVAKLLEANRQLELRRQLDVDGWAADVTSLRKTLAAVDRKLLQMRLIDRLEDDERLDALLDQLEKRKPSLMQQQEQQQQQKAKQQQQKAAGQRRLPSGAAGVGGGGGGAARGGIGGPFVGRRRASAAAAVGVGGSSRRPVGASGGRPASAAAGGAGAGGGRGGVAGGQRQSDQRQPRLRHRQQLGEGSEDEEAAAAGYEGGEEEDSEQQQLYGEHNEERMMDTGDVAAGGPLAPEDSSATTTHSDITTTTTTHTDSSSVSGAPSSIKSSLAAELAAVRRQLAELEVLAGQKAARALAGIGGGPRQPQ